MGSLAHTRSYGLLIPSDSTSYNFRRTSCTFHVKGCWPTYFSTWMSCSYHDEMELFRIPELALHILGQCETYPQLIALASTCTHLNSIWQRNKAYLIWAIGLQSRPAFNDEDIAALLLYSSSSHSFLNQLRRNLAFSLRDSIMKEREANL